MTAEPPSRRAAEPPALLAIYADESCLGNGREGSNPGAAAGVIEYANPDTGNLTRWDYWISEPATTNNRMALRSAIEAFRNISRKGVKFRVTFTSDSQYLVKGMSEWVFGWMSRGWKKKEGPILNLELWIEAVEAVRAGGHQVSWQWVRGHEGHPQNEYANHLATRAAREQTDSGGIVASQFDEWLAAERAKKRMAVEPQSFPKDAGFKALPAYPVVRPPTIIT